MFQLGSGVHGICAFVSLEFMRKVFVYGPQYYYTTNGRVIRDLRTHDVCGKRQTSNI